MHHSWSENWDLTVSARDIVPTLVGIFCKILKLPATAPIKIHHAHRALRPPFQDVDNPRDVICKLHKYTLKDRIMQKMHTLILMGHTFSFTRIYPGILSCSAGHFAPYWLPSKRQAWPTVGVFPFTSRWPKMTDRSLNYALKMTFHTSRPLLGWIQSTFRIGEAHRNPIPFRSPNPGYLLSAEAAKEDVNVPLLVHLRAHLPLETGGIHSCSPLSLLRDYSEPLGHPLDLDHVWTHAYCELLRLLLMESTAMHGDQNTIWLYFLLVLLESLSIVPLTCCLYVGLVTTNLLWFSYFL